MKSQNALLSSRESAVAVREAFRRGFVMDGIMMATLPLRLKIYRGRRRLRRIVTPGRKRCPEPQSGRDWQVDLSQAARTAREWFHAVPPPSGSADSTFRAAGGRRTVFPGEASRFLDVEDSDTWNRLYWALEPGGARTVAELCRWLNTPLSEEARHPYTTSERICTLAQVLGTRGGTLPSEVARQVLCRLLDDAEWLFDRVETHLGIQNHLLNNARALCAAGRFVSDSRRANLWLGRARAIWDEFWPKLILDDGVFGEQSSHYHALLTRTLLEYVQDARDSARSLPVGMMEKARAMCRVTNALMRSDGSLPLFGDISPDLPTSWLRGLPRVCERAGLLDETPRDAVECYAAGANAYFRNRAVEAPESFQQTPVSGWTSRLFPSGGFLFAVNPALELELAVHGDPRPTSFCHGDSGRGSFEIWFRGRPIVVDGGIPTYEPGELRHSFRGAGGQNVIALDDLAPVILFDEARALPRWYVDSLEGGTWQLDSAGAMFSWRGFRRYRPGLTWIRSWRWSGARLTIEDRVEGWTGEARVEARLHLGERGWSVRSPGIFTVHACEAHVAASHELKADLVEMPHATDYGVVVNGQGIQLSGRLSVPTSWFVSFEFDSGN